MRSDWKNEELINNLFYDRAAAHLSVHSAVCAMGKKESKKHQLRRNSLMDAYGRQRCFLRLLCTSLVVSQLCFINRRTCFSIGEKERKIPTKNKSGILINVFLEQLLFVNPIELLKWGKNANILSIGCDKLMSCFAQIEHKAEWKQFLMRFVTIWQPSRRQHATSLTINFIKHRLVIIRSSEKCIFASNDVINEMVSDFHLLNALVGSDCWRLELLPTLIDTWNSPM